MATKRAQKATPAEPEPEFEQHNISTLDDVAAGRTVTVRGAPIAPSFGLCAGTVADLQQVDKTVDPFTGNVVTRADLKK